MNIQTDRIYTVFKNENNYGVFYSIGISKKDINGNWINGYMPVRFRKDVNVDNETKIYIKKAWLDFYKDKNNATQTFIFISEFDTTDSIVSKANEEYENNGFDKSFSADEIILSSDDLPF